MKDNQKGVIGSYLSKGIKTTQLEVNTDDKTLRPIARLKEPRELFGVPKDKDNDYSQQAPRWPIECQVIEERIKHIPNVPLQPEPFYEQTGNELKPNPVGEENGIVVFNYNPISAVNYRKHKKSESGNNAGDDSSDSDVSSCESQTSSQNISSMWAYEKKIQRTIMNLLNEFEQRSSSNSNEDDDDDDDDDEDDDEEDSNRERAYKLLHRKNFDEKLKGNKKLKNRKPTGHSAITEQEIDDIWASKSPAYRAATPTFLKPQSEINDLVSQFNSVSPIKLKKELMSNLQAPSIRSNSQSRSSRNSPNDENVESQNLSESYKRLKENPLFNSDMSLNLNELVNYSKPLSSYAQECKNIKPQAKSNNVLSNANTNASNNNSQVLKVSGIPLRLYSAMSNSTSNQNQSLASSLRSQNDYNANKSSCLPQFSRSSFGGSKFLSNCHPYAPEEYDGLEFESRFESGNLAKAVQITPSYYELHVRPDLYTLKSKQWYYFRVKRTRKNTNYRFSIVNLIKTDSLYNEGMRPLMYSTINANTKGIGWVRCGDNICYFRNDDDDNPIEDDDDNCSYSLTFNVEFDHDNDTVFFAHSYPYTYSDLQDYLIDIQKDPIKSKFCKLRLLCRTLAGNNVYYLTVTTPPANEELMKQKKCIVVSARVHPSETPASWMMKGLMDFITGNSTAAKRLRHKCVFKLIPMLNPDGVIVGNTRNSLTGKDLNRQYRTVVRETYPSIWYTKALIKRLIDDGGVSMYCDMHAHSRHHNIFIYGCENKRASEKKLTEQVFPFMLHKNQADKFSFENCSFKVQRSKEGTGRIVVWMLGITNSYTIEASLGGSLLGSRKGTHFSTMDYEHMGRSFCETLLDYCDENPNKVKKNSKLLKRIKKIRKREKNEQKALKLKKLADQGCIIEEKLKVKQRTGKSVS